MRFVNDLLICLLWIEGKKWRCHLHQTGNVLLTAVIDEQTSLDWIFLSNIPSNKLDFYCYCYRCSYLRKSDKKKTSENITCQLWIASIWCPLKCHWRRNSAVRGGGGWCCKSFQPIVVKWSLVVSVVACQRFVKCCLSLSVDCTCSNQRLSVIVWV